MEFFILDIITIRNIRYSVVSVKLLKVNIEVSVLLYFKKNSMNYFLLDIKMFKFLVSSSLIRKPYYLCLITYVSYNTIQQLFMVNLYVAFYKLSSLGMNTHMTYVKFVPYIHKDSLKFIKMFVKLSLVNFNFILNISLVMNLSFSTFL